MKTLTVIQRLAYLLCIALIFTSCESEGTLDPGTDPEEEPSRTIFIGNFDNEWEVQGGNGHFIGIFRDEDSLDGSAGTLNGNEDHPVHGFSEMINGSFDGLDIQFTIARDDGASNVVFTGTMTPTSETDHQIIRMDLTTSDNEELVLTIN